MMCWVDNGVEMVIVMMMMAADVELMTNCVE